MYNVVVPMLTYFNLSFFFFSIMGPAKFRVTWRSYMVSFLITGVVIGIIVLILFIISKAGIDIPAPNGQNLFR